jgi:hypothetical protein
MVPEPSDLAAVRDFALDQTLRVKKGEPGADDLRHLVAQLRNFCLDELHVDGACHGCASRVRPIALLSELVCVQFALNDMAAEVREAILHRALHYREVRWQSRADPQSRPVECPFRDGERCLIAGAQPLSCLLGKVPTPTFADTAARVLQMGHAAGLVILGLDHHRVDLAGVLPELMGRQDWVEAFLAGETLFPEWAVVPGNRDAAIEHAKSVVPNQEPSGFPPADRAYERAWIVANEQGPGASFAHLDASGALGALWRLQTPSAYASESEVQEWRERFRRAMRRFAVTPFEPSSVYDALRVHCTANLAHSGLEVRSLLEEHGATIVAPAASRCLPSLCSPIEAPRRPGRIRVGYLSANLRFHNGGRWSLGWLRNHADDIESFVFVTAPQLDFLAPEFHRSAHHFFHLPGDVPNAARMIRGLDLDVMVFTDLGLDGANYQYAALRLARVQCTAWGHPVTSGLPTIDYYLSSELMEPPNAEEHYTERLVRLPGSGLYLERHSPTMDPREKGDFGLPSGRVVLLPGFPGKYVPRLDRLLAEVCDRLDLELVAFESVPYATAVTKNRFEANGVRVRWLPKMPPAEFRRVMELADLIIDPPAWNGGNTTIDALSYGKPVVTMPGEFMRGRHGLAFLTQSRLGPLIARSEQEFVRMACDAEAQAKAVERADFEGPFRDKAAVEALDGWIRSVS